MWAGARKIADRTERRFIHAVSASSSAGKVANGDSLAEELAIPKSGWAQRPHAGAVDPIGSVEDGVSGAEGLRRLVVDLSGAVTARPAHSCGAANLVWRLRRRAT